MTDSQTKKFLESRLTKDSGLTDSVELTDFQEAIKRYLKSKGIPVTSVKIIIVECICDWWGEDIKESLKGFYYKVRNEGTTYFFESYTGAFDHWTEEERSLGLELARKAVEKVSSVPSLEEKKGHCTKCKQKLSLDKELRLAITRYGMGCTKDDIRVEFKAMIDSGEYMCEVCSFVELNG